MMRLAVASTMLAALLLPASAGAFPIGNGHKPGVAIDAAGTAYIAWYGPESGTTTLRFCRLPRGATTCDISSTIPAPGTSLSRPFVTVSGSTVRIVHSRYGFTTPFNQIWQFTSTDGGATFDGGHMVGVVPFDEAVLGPGDTVSVASNAVTEGAQFQNVPLGGGSAGEAFAQFPAPFLYEGTVGLVDGATPLMVFADASGNALFRRYGGSGSLNDSASWSASTLIGYATYARLAGGPTGLFLLAGNETGDLGVRRFDGTTFTAPVIVSAGEEAQAFMAQDAGGQLHVAFPRITAAGFELVHAVSGDGAQWQSDVVLTQPSEGIGAVRVAAAADHAGVVVWESSSEIRAVAVGSPSPQFHQSVVVRPISGNVLVRRPGSRRFVELEAADAIPLGSRVDVKRGVLELTSQRSRGGGNQSARFRGGIFRVTQPGSVTQLALVEALARCGRGGAGAAARKKKSRRLWGDGKGKFRTSGRYSSATVRGTRWLVQDTCAGTRTRVVRGSVTVRDRVQRRTVILRAGRSYLARPRR